MEVFNIADDISDRIKWLEALCKKLDAAGRKKADAIANYDLTLAVAMAKLARGKVSQLEWQENGNTKSELLPENMPATVLPKYAAGMCHKEHADLEIATNEYKSLNTKIDTLLATLNAKQSIMRHMSQEVKM